MELFSNMKHNKTIIFITHHLQLNTWADSIIFLRKDGKVEVGTHEELTYNRKTRYSELWQNYQQNLEDNDTEFVLPAKPVLPMVISQQEWNN